MLAVTKTPDPGDDGEPCCKCRRPTPFWFAPKDVACCLECAAAATPDEIPSKLDWVNANLPPGMPPLPAGWLCAAGQRSSDTAAR